MRRTRELALIGLSLAVVVAISVADRIAGEDLRFGFLYLLPVALAAWWCQRSAALGVTAAAAAALLTNDLTFHAGPTLSATAWNEFTRMTTLFAFAVLISSVRLSEGRAKAESERAFHLAVTDPLTGLYNRHYLMEALTRLHVSAARHQRPYALLALDIDGLKQINDRHGHAAGDTALVEFATVLKRLARADDIVVRMGGDEFLVLLPEGQIADAAALGRRLLDATGGSGQHLVKSASAGAVQWRPTSAAKALVAEADRLVYEAKRSGGGLVIVSSESSGP